MQMHMNRATSYTKIDGHGSDADLWDYVWQVYDNWIYKNAINKRIRLNYVNKSNGRNSFHFLELTPFCMKYFTSASSETRCLLVQAFA
jgi:hypothetical protein